MDTEESYKNPDEQLKYAISLIQNAYTNKVEGLINEVDRLKRQLKEKIQTINELRNSLESAQSELHEKDNKLKQVEFDNKHLQQRVKKLTREITKLSLFRKQILKSVNDESFAADLGDEDLMYDSLTNQSTIHSSPTVKQEEKTFGGTGVESKTTLNTSPNSLSKGFQSPKNEDSAYFEGREFFNQAKVVLSFKQFNQFLSCIKRLNAGIETKEETLEYAKKIFGEEHTDLYNAFKKLLSKHAE